MTDTTAPLTWREAPQPSTVGVTERGFVIDVDGVLGERLGLLLLELRRDLLTPAVLFGVLFL